MHIYYNANMRNEIDYQFHSCPYLTFALYFTPRRCFIQNLAVTGPIWMRFFAALSGSPGATKCCFHLVENYFRFLLWRQKLTSWYRKRPTFCVAPVLQAYFTVIKLFLADFVFILTTEAQISKLLNIEKFSSNMAVKHGSQTGCSYRSNRISVRNVIPTDYMTFSIVADLASDRLTMPTMSVYAKYNIADQKPEVEITFVPL